MEKNIICKVVEAQATPPSATELSQVQSTYSTKLKIQLCFVNHPLPDERHYSDQCPKVLRHLQAEGTQGKHLCFRLWCDIQLGQLPWVSTNMINMLGCNQMFWKDPGNFPIISANIRMYKPWTDGPLFFFQTSSQHDPSTHGVVGEASCNLQTCPSARSEQTLSQRLNQSNRLNSQSRVQSYCVLIIVYDAVWLIGLPIKSCKRA